MMNFSQRIVIAPLTKAIQVQAMDDDLRTGLWNTFSQNILSYFDKSPEHRGLPGFSRLIWMEFFKRQVESAPITFPGLKMDLTM